MTRDRLGHVAREMIRRVERKEQIKVLMEAAMVQPSNCTMKLRVAVARREA